MLSVSDRYRAAVDALGRKDFAIARSHAEAVLKAQPGNPTVLQLLGVILGQAGDAQSAVGYFRRALKEGGDTADNRLNLAKALLAIGEQVEAAALCEGGVADGSPDLQRMRAEIMKAQGRRSESLITYERLAADNADSFEAWNNLGNARHESGDLDGALVALQRARECSLDSSLVHLNIGRLLISLDRYDDAAAMFGEAARLDPNDPQPLLDLGRALAATDRSAEALPALGGAARLDPRDPQIFVAMGLAFTDLDERAKAEQAYRVALQVDPTFASAYLNLGFLLEQDNRLDELRQLVARAIAVQMSGADMDYLRALLMRRQGKSAEALELAKTVKTTAIDPAIVSHFVGQLADRLNRIPEAYQAFEDMNWAAATSPLGAKADRTKYQQDIARMARVTTPEWFSSWPPVAPCTAPPSPTFLVGFPRSGTTLLDTVLLGHSRIHVLEEIPILETVASQIGNVQNLAALDADAVAGLRDLYFKELGRLSPPAAGALVIDKNPLSMLRAPLIHRLFPDARIILAMRHPVDVVLSCWMQNFKPTEAMASFFDLTNASQTYDRIFGYWEKCRSIFPLNVHDLRYEDMVADMDKSIRPLIAFLGLEWEEGVLDHQRTAIERGHIRTPSYAQVTEPVYARASGRWTRYRDYLADALPILAPWCERYGYPLD